MRPTSDDQYAATQAGAAAPMEQVRDGIWAIAQPFASVNEVYTLNYAIEDEAGDIHLIDPGADVGENFERLVASLDSIGHTIDDVATITVTHMHYDHLGLAERVRSASGARLALHSAEQLAVDARLAPLWTDPATLESWGVPSARFVELVEVARAHPPMEGITADVLLNDGDLLEVPGRELRVIHTPGHTVGHICIESPELLFSGDHVLPNQFSGIGLGGDRGTNPLRDIRASLARVASLDELEVCPGHAWRFAGVAGRCADILAHHAKRTTQVAAVLAEQPDATVWEVASQLTWTAGWENLAGYYIGSALGQAQMHMDLVLAGE